MGPQGGSQKKINADESATFKYDAKRKGICGESETANEVVGAAVEKVQLQNRPEPRPSVWNRDTLCF